MRLPVYSWANFFKTSVQLHRVINTKRYYSGTQKDLKNHQYSLIIWLRKSSEKGDAARRKDTGLAAGTDSLDPIGQLFSPAGPTCSQRLSPGGKDWTKFSWDECWSKNVSTLCKLSTKIQVNQCHWTYFPLLVYAFPGVCRSEAHSGLWLPEPSGGGVGQCLGATLFSRCFQEDCSQVRKVGTHYLCLPWVPGKGLLTACWIER